MYLLRRILLVGGGGEGSPEIFLARSMAWVKEHGAVTKHVVLVAPPLEVTSGITPAAILVLDDAEAAPGNSNGVAVSDSESAPSYPTTLNPRR